MAKRIHVRAGMRVHCHYIIGATSPIRINAKCRYFPSAVARGPLWAIDGKGHGEAVDLASFDQSGSVAHCFLCQQIERAAFVLCAPTPPVADGAGVALCGSWHGILLSIGTTSGFVGKID
jgi:hypothetical protein